MIFGALIISAPVCCMADSSNVRIRSAVKTRIQLLGLTFGGGSSRPSSLLNKQPGEGTGPTIHADFQVNLVGRVP